MATTILLTDDIIKHNQIIFALSLTPAKDITEAFDIKETLCIWKRIFVESRLFSFILVRTDIDVNDHERLSMCSLSY